MNIFVDESGTFRTSPHPDSWCTVVAYVSPEIDRRRLDRLVGALRAECASGREAKLRNVAEARYAKFLSDLARLNGVAFAVAVDAHQHSECALELHRDSQARAALEHIDKMLHPTGREAVQRVSDAIRSLPVQLYAQLVCQVELFHKVITRAITYYAQRFPATLRSLRWRVDRKDTIPTAYENTFRMILPALLQSKSDRDPMLMLKGADYSHFRRFEYAPGEAPTYLKDDYGIDYGEDVVDVGKMVKDDFQLVDSNNVPGVQVADLLASGLRRVMRQKFDAPERIATLIGENMVQEADRQPPVRLISLAPGSGDRVSTDVAKLLRSMVEVTRPYIARR